MAQHPAMQHEIKIENKHGEKLVGVLHETGSNEIVVVCHGFLCTKKDQILLRAIQPLVSQQFYNPNEVVLLEPINTIRFRTLRGVAFEISCFGSISDQKIIKNLSMALENAGITVFRFDFTGNGESEGLFQFGYYRETEDIRAVIEYFGEANRPILAILGHSKAGDVVLLYASKYHDTDAVINVSGRYYLHQGIEQRLGRNFMERVKKDGFIDFKNKGKVYRVTNESLMERLNTNMYDVCLSIDKRCRVLTIHGSSDTVIKMEDAQEFDKVIPNHKLHIIQGADHGYTEHQAELASTIVDYLKHLQLSNNIEV